MLKSLQYSNFFIRGGLAIVFLWFGVDKFFSFQYWLDAWIPGWLVNMAGVVGIGPAMLVYLFGIFEVLVGVSLLSGVFMLAFAILASIFMVFNIIFAGLGNLIVRDIGLLGALLALISWPQKNNHIY